MLATSGPFQTMVEGQEQTQAWSLSMTLPAAASAFDDVTLAVQAVQIDESTVTDAPDGTRLEEGYSSMQATFTLSGQVGIDESQSAAWLFGPYSLTSPLYHSDAFRAPVVIKLGLYPDGAGGVPELLTKFTGYVEDYTVDEDGNVAFTCLDLRSDFRGTVTLPAVVTAPPFNAGLTSEFAVDAILRAASGGLVSSWPKQRPQCLLAVGFRSSLWPEAGTLSTSAVPTFRPGVFGTALGLLDTTVGGPGTYGLAASTVSDFTMECWINDDVAGAEAISPTVLLTASGVNPRRIWLNYVRSATAGASGVKVTYDTGFATTPETWNVATATGAHYIGLHVNAGTGAVTVRLDGASHTLTMTVTNGPYVTATVSASAFPTPPTTLEAWLVTAETSPVWNDAFIPQSVLDPSLNPLQLVPAVEGDPWATIQTIAAAELAVAGFDESGIFRYQNRATIRGKTSSRTITSTTSLKSLGISQTAAAVVNRARVGSTGWTFETSATTVYSTNTPIKVAKYSTKIVRSDLDMFAVLLDGSVSNLPNNSTDKVHSFYRASSSKAGVAEHPGGLSFVVSQTAANQLTVTITNTSGVDAWLVSPANYTDLTVGTPVLRVGGTNVVQNDEVVADYQFPHAADGGASSTRFGEVLFEMTGSAWIQDDDAAAQLAQDIVVDSCVPRPDLTGVNIVPDPRLQLTDVALIQDPDRTGVNEYGRIFASTITFDAGGGNPSYEQSIDARTLAPPGGWIGGVAGRSEGDITTWGY